MASRGQRIQAVLAAEAVRDGLTLDEAVALGVAPTSYKKMVRIKDYDRTGTIFPRILSGELGMVPAATALGLHKTKKTRERLALGGLTGFAKKDLFDEATAPLLMQMRHYRRLSFDFPHVSPVEARRRLEVLDDLMTSLQAVREGLKERSHTYTTRVPNEDKREEREGRR